MLPLSVPKKKDGENDTLATAGASILAGAPEFPALKGKVWIYLRIVLSIIFCIELLKQ